MIRVLAIFAFLAFSGVSSAQVIAENFRNTACANCKEPDEQYEEFIALNPSYKVILINYHNGSPSPNDPFYLASKNDVNPRSNVFYGVAADPYMFIQGYSAGSKVSDWKTLTTEANAIKSPFTVNVTKSLAGNIITIEADVTGSSSQQVRPYALILESDIVYNNEEDYGNPLSGKWNDVVRAIVPTPNGGDPVTISGSQHFQFTYDITGKGWNPENIHIVFFLQQVTMVTPGINYPILGVNKTSKGFTSVKKSKEYSGFSLKYGGVNPFTRKNYVKLASDKPAQVKVVISNVLGNTVATAFEGYVAGGEQVVDLDIASLNEGVYFARLFVGNEQVDVVKIENLLPLFGR
ncbi:MAG TPA: Omp28-related outer membrane protein [Candidatus Kapabacteria bacterium]